MTVARIETCHDLPAPGCGRLLLDTSRSALSPHLRDHRVTVTVDGYPLRFAWGRTSIDLPAGRHQVEIEVEDTDGWGRVVDDVPVAAGHTVEAYYRAPALRRVGGALGPSAQRTRGVSAWAALAAAVGTLVAGLATLLVLIVLGVAGVLT